MIYRRKKRSDNSKTAHIDKRLNKENKDKDNKPKSILLPFFLTIIILILLGVGAFFIGMHFAKEYFASSNNKNSNKKPVIEKNVKPTVTVFNNSYLANNEKIDNDFQFFFPPDISYTYNLKELEKKEKKTYTKNTRKRTYSNSSGVYYLQAGLFLKRSNAMTRISKLRSLGYSAYVQETYSYGRKMYRVVLGRYSTRSQAQAVKSRLTGAGFSDIFILSY